MLPQLVISAAQLEDLLTLQLKFSISDLQQQNISAFEFIEKWRLSAMGQRDAEARHAHSLLRNVFLLWQQVQSHLTPQLEGCVELDLEEIRGGWKDIPFVDVVPVASGAKTALTVQIINEICSFSSDTHYAIRVSMADREDNKLVNMVPPVYRKAVPLRHLSTDVIQWNDTLTPPSVPVIATEMSCVAGRSDATFINRIIGVRGAVLSPKFARRDRAYTVAPEDPNDNPILQHLDDLTRLGSSIDDRSWESFSRKLSAFIDIQDDMDPSLLPIIGRLHAERDDATGDVSRLMDLLTECVRILDEQGEEFYEQHKNIIVTPTTDMQPDDADADGDDGSDDDSDEGDIDERVSSSPLPMSIYDQLDTLLSYADMEFELMLRNRNLSQLNSPALSLLRDPAFRLEHLNAFRTQEQVVSGDSKADTIARIAVDQYRRPLSSEQSEHLRTLHSADNAHAYTQVFPELELEDKAGIDWGRFLDILHADLHELLGHLGKVVSGSMMLAEYLMLLDTEMSEELINIVPNNSALGIIISSEVLRSITIDQLGDVFISLRLCSDAIACDLKAHQALLQRKTVGDEYVGEFMLPVEWQEVQRAVKPVRDELMEEEGDSEIIDDISFLFMDEETVSFDDIII
eukprot:gnl/Dysnectes_brevis/5153_a7284_534.p1 GENE.gnl/Dysnectes_brevis/5153_a7284_534~~gnl/Dysnectes_brevis/5153_a7284_534.p1  ORF type:complete len:717 (-),score=211.54 gnl/Dysnectes_brevis/5153_a7284_534:40-1929(-)